MRNMSFAWTTEAFLRGEKDVTRRLGWRFVKVGEHVCAIEKGQGLKKGEKVRRLGFIEILNVRREPLNAIEQEAGGAKREGYRALSEVAFVAGFCDDNKCKATTEVTRIEFKVLKYLVEPQGR